MSAALNFEGIPLVDLAEAQPPAGFSSPSFIAGANAVEFALRRMHDDLVQAKLHDAAHSLRESRRALAAALVIVGRRVAP